MFGNSGAYLETPLRRPHFQTPSVPTPSLTFPSFTGGRTPGVFVTPGGGILPSAGFGGDDRGEKIAMSHKMLRQKSQGHVVDVLQMQKDAAECKEADLIQQKSALESRIKRLNEEAESARLHADRMNKRIEFLEQRAAESSSTTSRQISELTDEVQQLQEALLLEKSQCGLYRRDVDDVRRAVVDAEQSKLAAEQSLIDANTELQEFAVAAAEHERKIADLEDSLSVAEEQRDAALKRIIQMESELEAANSSVSALSSDLQACRDSEKQMAARARALAASLQKIEVAFANGEDESSTAMAALVEQSRRGGDASKGLQAMGVEMKRLNLQVTELQAVVADLKTQLRAAVEGRERAEADAAACQAREAKSKEKMTSLQNDTAQLKRHIAAIEKRVCGHWQAEGDDKQEVDSRCQELERALSAAVLAEGVARSKANIAKQELARVKAMSAAQVLQSQKQADHAKLMLEALETRFIDNAQELCSNAALTQAVRAVAAPPRSRKVARAWAHPGTDVGGVVGGVVGGSAVDDEADDSLKQKRRSR